MKRCSKAVLFVSLCLFVFTDLIRININGNYMMILIGISLFLIVVGFLLLLFSTPVEQIEYKTKSANQFNQKRKQLKTTGIALAWKIDTVKMRTCNDVNDFKLSVNRFLFASLFR